MELFSGVWLPENINYRDSAKGKFVKVACLLLCFKHIRFILFNLLVFLDQQFLVTKQVLKTCPDLRSKFLQVVDQWFLVGWVCFMA